MRRGRDPDLVDVARPSVLEVAWTRCRHCGRRCDPGHSVTAPTAAYLYWWAYHRPARRANASIVPDDVTAIT